MRDDKTEQSIKAVAEFLNEINKCEEGDRDHKLEDDLERVLIAAQPPAGAQEEPKPTGTAQYGGAAPPRESELRWMQGIVEHVRWNNTFFDTPEGRLEGAAFHRALDLVSSKLEYYNRSSVDKEGERAFPEDQDSKTVPEYMADLAYVNGARAGWNAALSGDESFLGSLEYNRKLAFEDRRQAVPQPYRQRSKPMTTEVNKEETLDLLREVDQIFRAAARKNTFPNTVPRTYEYYQAKAEQVEGIIRQIEAAQRQGGEAVACPGCDNEKEDETHPERLCEGCKALRDLNIAAEPLQRWAREITARNEDIEQFVSGYEPDDYSALDEREQKLVTGAVKAYLHHTGMYEHITAPQPAVPEGYVLMPKKLSRSNVADIVTAVFDDCCEDPEFVDEMHEALVWYVGEPEPPEET